MGRKTNHDVLGGSELARAGQGVSRSRGQQLPLGTCQQPPHWSFSLSYPCSLCSPQLPKGPFPMPAVTVARELPKGPSWPLWPWSCSPSPLTHATQPRQPPCCSGNSQALLSGLGPALVLSAAFPGRLTAQAQSPCRSQVSSPGLRPLSPPSRHSCQAPHSALSPVPRPMAGITF